MRKNFKIIKEKALFLFHMLIGTEDSVYYINGAENLPAPLTKEREEEILNEISKKDFSNRELLITHNLRLVVYIAKKFDNTGVGIDDIVSIGTIGLIKAVKTFSPERNIKLATYASRCIENEILMHLRKTAHQRKEISFDEPLNIDWDGNELFLCDVLGNDSETIEHKMVQEDEKNQLLRMISNLEEREKSIMTMRYGLFGSDEYTQKEVADKLGISQSYISRLEKKIIEKLKEQFIKEM